MGNYEGLSIYPSERRSTGRATCRVLGQGFDILPRSYHILYKTA